MNRFLNRIELVVIALLAFAALVIWATQTLWITPGKQCEAEGNWWDAKTRICGHVVYLPNITHRPIGSKQPRYPDLPRTRAQAAEAASGPAPAAPPRRSPEAR